jgi:hypothetical protein
MKEHPLFRSTPAELARLKRIASVQPGAVKGNAAPQAYPPGRSVVLAKPAVPCVSRPPAPMPHAIQTKPAAPGTRPPNNPAGPYRAAAMPLRPAVQPARPFNGPARAIQAKVVWSGSKGAYEGDGNRPKWRKHLIKHATDHYNKTHSTSHPANVDFVSLASDRTHKYPYSRIESAIVEFCNSSNNSSDRQALQEMCGAVLTPSNGRYSSMCAVLKKLFAAVPQESQTTVCTLANKLLSELNSSTDNVLAGLDKDNRGIGDDWDLNYQKTPGGTHFDLTPKGKNMYTVTTQYGLGTSLPLTPTGQHYRTSQYGSEKPLVASTLIPTVSTTGFSFSTQATTNNNSQPSQLATQPSQVTTQPISSNTNQSVPSQTFSSQTQFQFQQPVTIPQFAHWSPPSHGYYPNGFWYWPGDGVWHYFKPGVY